MPADTGAAPVICLALAGGCRYTLGWRDSPFLLAPTIDRETGGHALRFDQQAFAGHERILLALCVRAPALTRPFSSNSECRIGRCWTRELASHSRSTRDDHVLECKPTMCKELKSGQGSLKFRDG